MITLYFTKEFTGGVLKGLRFNESMRFANEKLAADWATWARKGCKKPIGGWPYKIIDASFQNYTR